MLLVLVFETLISNLLKPQKDEDQYKHLDPGFRRLGKKGDRFPGRLARIIQRAA